MKTLSVENTSPTVFSNGYAIGRGCVMEIVRERHKKGADTVVEDMLKNRKYISKSMHIGKLKERQ